MKSGFSATLNDALILQQAMNEVSQGNYQKAKELFLQVEGSIESPKLNYNLGVVNYKLGYYDSARKQFLKVATDKKLDALAYYNLALIEIKFNDYNKAQYWLNQTVAKNDNSQLNRLALNLMDKIYETQVEERSEAESDAYVKSRPVKNKFDPFSRSITTSLQSFVGYNDNVEQFSHISSSNPDESQDSFLSLYGNAKFAVNKKFDIAVSFNYLDYSKKNNFDVIDVGLIAAYKSTFRLWNYSFGGSFIKQNLDKKEFQYISGWNVALNRSLASNVLYEFQYIGNEYRVQEKLYQHLSGVQHSGLNRLHLFLPTASLSIAYGIEFNDRKDYFPVDTPQHKSFSPLVHSLNFNVVMNTFQKLDFAIFTNFSWSKFGTANGVKDSPTNKKRFDQQFEYGFRLAYPLIKNLSVKLDFQKTHNYSNISEYKYSNNLYKFGFIWHY